MFGPADPLHTQGNTVGFHDVLRSNAKPTSIARKTAADAVTYTRLMPNIKHAAFQLFVGILACGPSAMFVELQSDQAP